MDTVLVWMLVLMNHNGGISQTNNIATWEDCERMRLRAEAAAPSRNYVSGSCTQIGILVPKPMVVTVQPSTAVIKNTVVIKKAK
jgi:hypothetical protein